jgi:hypothetical protein
MKIKTSEQEGTLIYMSNNDESNYLKVFFRFGFLVAKLKMGREVSTELESLYIVAENEWKEIQVNYEWPKSRRSPACYLDFYFISNMKKPYWILYARRKTRNLFHIHNGT